MDQADPQVGKPYPGASGHGARACVALLVVLGACGGEGAGTADLGAAGAPNEVVYPDYLPYAKSVESFSPGEGAGYGTEDLPDVVLGPPRGRGASAGSLHVLSLGDGGEIVLGLGRLLEDQTGPDFIVFENAFWPSGDSTSPYAELGEVSVSEDGELWSTFPCDTKGDGNGHFPGCAGVTPTLNYDPLELVPLSAEAAGGDAFDLAEVGAARARFVKIRDLSTLEPEGPVAGFDLDAVGLMGQVD